MFCTFALAEGFKIHIVMHRGHAQKINAVIALHPNTNLRVIEPSLATWKWFLH